MLDLRRIEVLCTIATTGSLSAAAMELTYSTPAVWYHVRRLEAEVGQPLLISHSRGVRLTPAGEVLARHGAQMLERARRAETEIATLDVGVVRADDDGADAAAPDASQVVTGGAR